ncbi:response regulator transcription factor [Marinilactibacillus sp. XAAS-LB27]|uniref:response regulator transcription factor n=1 Tax=Marinilactibacillus sp. XAAS-LB27 TaxID=3114538 RepID=UPI002E18B269|nr:response regulator transcription factor [Marinilactibacillus sp. XAAS-LB27]
MNKPTILIVEDDQAVRKLISTTVELEGYQYRTAETGREGLIELVSKQPDILILDLGLPDMDGVSIVETVRGWSNLPIIIVSARSEDQDKIRALDAGADDYLTKPFSVEELLARLRALLRRLRTDQQTSLLQSSIIENGSLKIDYAAGIVWINDKELHLTPIEYKLISLLAKNIGKVLTHNYILNEVWGKYYDDVPVLRVFMAGLRKKLRENSPGEDYIQTHIGVGYRMLRVEL